jgi:hypothetical protein
MNFFVVFDLGFLAKKSPTGEVGLLKFNGCILFYINTIHKRPSFFGKNIFVRTYLL